MVVVMMMTTVVMMMMMMMLTVMIFQRSFRFRKMLMIKITSVILIIVPSKLHIS